MRAGRPKPKLPWVVLPILTASSFGHVVNVPIERVDVADWLSNLTSDEYRRCYPGAHIAAGLSWRERGGPLWIQTELIGERVLVHQYVGELVERRRCRLASRSVVVSALGRTTVRVLWELSVEPFDDSSCEYVNHLAAVATDELLSFTRAHGIGVETTAASYADAFETHNEHETASFAASIEHRALADGQL